MGANEDLIAFNLYAYCSNNPVMGYDPTGNVNWWGVVAGVSLAVVGVAVIIASDGIASTIGTTLLLEAGSLIATTGLITTQCAVDESAMVIDVSASDSNGTKNGSCVVIDFEKNTFDFYGHSGYTSSKYPTLTYSAGIVDNYEEIGDYAGPFLNGGITYSWLGGDYCRSPDLNPNSVSAKSITFSFFGSFDKKIGLYGGWDDYYHIGSWGG